MKKETPILLISLVLTGLIVFILTGLITDKLSFSGNLITIFKPASSTKNNELDNKIRISFGGKSLIDKEELSSNNPQFRAAKQKGIEALKSNNYLEAVKQFETAIGYYKNAPETLIYLNNSRAELVGEPNYYTIAVAVPITNNLESALKLLRGVAQVQHEIHALGGIQGKFLKVIIADDNYDPKIASQVAQELSDNPEIMGVVGHFSSSTTLAAAEVYKQNQLVSVSGTSTSTELSNFSNYFFRTIPNDSIAAAALANYMLNDLDKRKAAIFYEPDNAYSNSLKEAFTIALSFGQGELVGDFNIAGENFDAFDSFQEAKKEGAEVLMLASSTKYLQEAIQIININSNTLDILAGDAMYHIDILKMAGKDSVGIVTGVAWHINGNLDTKFPETSRNLWGADVDAYTAMTYDAAQALVKALANTETREDVRKNLANRSFSAPGVSEEIKFLPSGDRNASVQLVEVKAVGNSRSGTGYDFVPFN